MKRVHLQSSGLRWIAALGMALFSLATSAQAQVFTFTDLGTLDPPAGFTPSSEAFDVNDLGHVAGRSRGADGLQHVVLYRGGLFGLEDLGTFDPNPPGVKLIVPSVEKVYINNFGTMAGTIGSLVSQRFAFYLDDDGFIPLEEGDITGNRTTSFVTALNNNDQAVGFTRPDFPTVANPPRGSLWNDGGPEIDLSLATNEPFIGTPQDVSDNTEIVFAPNSGTAAVGAPAFFWDGGTPIEIPNVGGPFGVNIPVAVNNNALVVGNVRKDAAAFDAYFWDPENGLRVMPHDELPAQISTTRPGGPVDMNNLGQVVGNCNPPPPGLPVSIVPEDRCPSSFSNTPYLYLPEPAFGLSAGLHYLPGLIQPRPAGQLFVTAISNAGHIAGYTDLGSGRRRGFLLTPNQLQEVDPFVDRFDSSPNYVWSAEHGDPVNTFTGEFVHLPPPDFDLGGALPLRFRRYLGTFLYRDRKIEGRLGTNWLHNFEWQLSRSDDGTQIAVVNDFGQVIRFDRDGSAWVLTRTPDAPYQLLEQAGGFLLGDPQAERMYTFDLGGKLTRIEDRRGNAHTLTYDEDLLTQVADGAGRALTFSYDADGFLTHVSDGTRSSSFSYNIVSGLRGLSLVLGAGGRFDSYTTALPDPAFGLLPTEVVTPESNVALSYDAQGRVQMQQDGNEAETTFAYDADGTTVTDPLGTTQQYVHTEAGGLASRTDEAGRVITAGSDADGRRGTVDGAGGGTTQIAYHAGTGEVETVTYADGGTLRKTYTPNPKNGITFFDVTEVSYPDGTRETFAYDGNGNLLSATDRGGATRTFTYDATGQVLSATNPAGGTTAFTYNADGTVASFTDPRGGTTTFSYDALGRRTQQTYPDGRTRAFAYDGQDRLTAETNEAGGTTSSTYNGFGNLFASTDPLGQATTYAYDGDGRLKGITDPLGAFSSVDYDDRGRATQVVDPNGNTTAYSYDAVGNPISVVDPGGNTWSRAYDADNRLVSATNPVGATVTYTYDANGRITQLAGPEGASKQFTYDALGRLLRMDESGNGSTEYSYDALGRLTGLTFDGGTTTLERNALGDLAKVTGPSGGVWERTYDASGALLSFSDPLGQTHRYSYDARGRATRVAMPGVTLDVTHDAVGNVLRQDYSDGTSFIHTYDAAGRRTSATGATFSYDARGDLTESNGLTIGRDPGGRITTVTLAPGKTLTYTYDARDRVTRLDDWAGGSTQFTYDAAGRLTALERPNGITTTYAYDLANRIVSIRDATADSVLAEHTLSRRVGGDVTAATRTVPQLPETAPDAVALSFDAASQAREYSHDGLGRVTADDQRSYTWNGASQLIRYVEDGTTVDFAYDAFDRMTSRSEAGVTETFAWNEALTLPSISVVRSGGADVRYYVHTPQGLLLHSIDAADDTRHFYHYDELGNTLFLTDAAGAVVQAYAYGPYGELLGFADGGVDNPFTYLGQFGIMQEGTTGLFVMRRRFYDSHSKRLLSRDPVGEQVHPLLLNPYQYAAQNPMRYIDPMGEDPGEWRYEGSPLDQAISTTVSFVSPATFISGGLLEGFSTAGTGRTRGVLDVFDDAYDTARTNYRNGVGSRDFQLRHADRLDDVRTRGAGLAKNLDRLGNAANVVGVLSEGYKTHERVRAEVAQARMLDDASTAISNGQIVALREALDAKLITPRQFLRWSDRITRDFEMRRRIADGTETVFGVFDVKRRNIGLVTELTVGFKEMLKVLVPDPRGLLP